MEKTDVTDAFWQDVKAAVPDAGETYGVRRLGANQRMAEIIYDLVKSGEKTGTFGLKMMHDRDPANTPSEGSTTVFVDFDGQPHAAVRVLSLTPTAYKDITEDHLVVEGPGARKLKTWQEIHWPHWTNLLAPHGLEPREDMTVMVERFELLYPPLDKTLG